LPPKRGIPVVETIAGKGGLTHDHPVHAGPIGIVGSTSANALAAEADVILAIGTRLQDFTTGSWTAFARRALHLDQRRALRRTEAPRAGRGGRCAGKVSELDAGLGAWKAPGGHLPRAKAVRRLGRAAWTTTRPRPTPRPDLCAGGQRGEPVRGRERHPDRGRRRHPGRGGQGLAGQGAEQLRPRVRLFLHGLRDRRRLGLRHGTIRAGGLGGTPIVMLGDGTYMMMNSDIYSTVLSGHKMIVVVCDNGGYAVISRLQQFKGVPGFNNLLKDCRITDKAEPPARRFRRTPKRWGPPPQAAKASPTWRPR
jgi:3D-(3,5/4)-trihydroxycyclohexane-1,2-dione acylhydrolase (decyclizing)